MNNYRIIKTYKQFFNSFNGLIGVQMLLFITQLNRAKVEKLLSLFAESKILDYLISKMDCSSKKNEELFFLCLMLLSPFSFYRAWSKIGEEIWYDSTVVNVGMDWWAPFFFTGMFMIIPLLVNSFIFCLVSWLLWRVSLAKLKCYNKIKAILWLLSGFVEIPFLIIGVIYITINIIIRKLLFLLFGSIKRWYCCLKERININPTIKDYILDPFDFFLSALLSSGIFTISILLFFLYYNCYLFATLSLCVSYYIRYYEYGKDEHLLRNSVAVCSYVVILYNLIYIINNFSLFEVCTLSTTLVLFLFLSISYTQIWKKMDVSFTYYYRIIVKAFISLLMIIYLSNIISILIKQIRLVFLFFNDVNEGGSWNDSPYIPRYLGVNLFDLLPLEIAYLFGCLVLLFSLKPFFCIVVDGFKNKRAVSIDGSVLFLRSFNDKLDNDYVAIKRLFRKTIKVEDPHSPIIVGKNGIYLTDKNWKKYVENYISSSKQVILVVGTTPGIQWEMITHFEQCEKFIYVVKYHENLSQFIREMKALDKDIEFPEIYQGLLSLDSEKWDSCVFCIKDKKLVSFKNELVMNCVTEIMLNKYLIACKWVCESCSDSIFKKVHKNKLFFNNDGTYITGTDIFGKKGHYLIRGNRLIINNNKEQFNVSLEIDGDKLKMWGKTSHGRSFNYVFRMDF